MDGVLERHGQIDLLVNNAGGQYLTPAEDITPKGFRTVMRLNVEGTWLMTHAVATRAMIPDARGGKIVNVTLSPHHGLPGMAHSSAARAAVENLTRVLSIEWARFGIRLTALAAGPLRPPRRCMTKYPQPVVEGVAGTVPLGRLGTEEEFAWLVAYVASPGRATTSRARSSRSTARATTGSARGRPAGSWTRPGSRSTEETQASERPRAAHRTAGHARLPRGGPGRPGGDLRGPEVTAMGRRPGRISREETWRRMAYLVGHWELRGFGHWALFEQDSRRARRPRRALLPEGWPGTGGGLAGRPRRTGASGYAPEAGRAPLRLGPRRARRRPRDQPDRAVRTSGPSGWRRSSARRLEGQTTAHDAEIRRCVVYGDGSALALQPRRHGTVAQDDADRDDRGSAGGRGGGGRRRRGGRDRRRPARVRGRGGRPSVDEASARMIEGGEGVRRASSRPRSDLRREAASHGENRYAPTRTTSATTRLAGEADVRRRRGRRGRRPRRPDDPERRAVSTHCKGSDPSSVLSVAAGWTAPPR